jgi:hypothetical protein
VFKPAYLIESKLNLCQPDKPAMDYQWKATAYLFLAFGSSLYYLMQTAVLARANGFANPDVR